jgi:hypothetical protein
MTNTNYTVVVTPLRPANWGSSQIVNSAMGVWQGSKTITHFDLIADSTFSPGPNSSEVVVIG